MVVSWTWGQPFWGESTRSGLCWQAFNTDNDKFSTCGHTASLAISFQYGQDGWTNWRFCGAVTITKQCHCQRDSLWWNTIPDGCVCVDIGTWTGGMVHTFPCPTNSMFTYNGMNNSLPSDWQLLYGIAIHRKCKYKRYNHPIKGGGTNPRGVVQLPEIWSDSGWILR